MTAPIRRFKIDVSAKNIDDLQKRLELTRFPDEVDDAGWAYGAPLGDIKRLIEHWRSSFDWKKHEARINTELPQFKTEVIVDGFGPVDMHFVHQPSPVPGAIPLIFVHGWPGSFFEAAKLLPLLKNNKDGPAFHLVAPSLPNFGFSSRVSEKGFNLAKYAEACHKVMLALGYSEYVTQGGDWGFFVTRALGYLYPDSVKALHTNWPLPNFPSFVSSPVLAVTSALKHLMGSYLYTAAEAEGIKRLQDWAAGSGRGYYAMLATRPQTIGYTFADSPVGLLSFIYEKLHDWTDDYPWADDEILTWISIYWFSEAGPSAASFIYYEAEQDPALMLKLRAWMDKPLGFHFFPKEIGNLPRSWAAGLGRVAYVAESTEGGHFAAWEKPEEIVGDLNKMFQKGGPAYGVVKGKDGY